MATYCITGTRRERLDAWLAFHGLHLERHRCRESKAIRWFVRVPRRRGRPMKLWMYETREGGVEFVGDRNSHKSSWLARVARDFSEAERWMPGTALGDRIAAQTRRHLETQRDDQVVSLIEYFDGHPIDLGQLVARPRLSRGCTTMPDLSGLVNQMHNRLIYASEPARREALFAPENTGFAILSKI